MRDHPRAVKRDLLVLRLRMQDLSLDDLASVVLAAPPGSAVRWAVQHGWTATDHLLANMTEQQAGLIHLSERYPRPGVLAADESDGEEKAAPTADEVHIATRGGGQFDRFESPADFEKALAARLAQNQVSTANGDGV